MIESVLRFVIVSMAWMLAYAAEAEGKADALIAEWAFESLENGKLSDVAGENEARVHGGGITLGPGVLGKCAVFEGQHEIRVDRGPDFSNITRITLTAWVRPTRFDPYNEIFRKEDGERRVLFSFQENGTILALGLNIGGYIECDAPIDRSALLDGDWHHAAATFDGRTMRVYLDGVEIASLDRPGDISAGGPAQGCIGSSNGGECFQGGIDELRIYSEALSDAQIAELVSAGNARLGERLAAVEEQFTAIYVACDTFGETIGQTRKRLAESDMPPSGELSARFVRELRGKFPEEVKAFFQWTQMSSVDLLTTGANDSLVAQAKHFYELLTEYKPLTPAQWEKQTPEQLAKWKEADAFGERICLLSDQGESGHLSHEWIALICEMGPKIEFRPIVQEAVAPYQTPSTPETRDLTSEEAEEQLRRDWLHQVDGRPSAEQIRREIAWTNDLIRRLERQYGGLVDFAAEKTELELLESRMHELLQDDAELYFAVRRLKRTVMFSNPVIHFDKVLFVDMPYPAGSEWRHETRHRLGYMAVPGARLMILEGLSPEGHLTQLMPQEPLHGSFWRPDVSFDADRVLFCFKPHNEKAFHLYEINADGTGLRQITDGIFDDFDPIYLPDGEHIAFTTTRGHTYVRCMPPTNAFVLARCRLDGTKMYFISRNNEPDYLPSVMHDGRIIYTRWEYTDKPLWRAQGIWTVNPDGTQINTFWGNQSVWPDLLKDARQIPGSRRVMFTGSAHHDWFAGSVGILDPDKGFNFPYGLTKVTADTQWPESGNGPIDPVESPMYHAAGKYVGYYSPYPLSETDFLVSAEREGTGKFVLYLMDVDGNRELIYEGAHNIFHAMPLAPRPRPPVIVDRVEWPAEEERLKPKPGVLYSGNVYFGAPEVLRGKAKYLRVLNIDPKTYTYWHKRPYLSTGPVVSMVQSEGVKRIIGTVPIDSDGSVAFNAPSGMALHFQLLDENHLALQTMRSFVGVQPGEKRGCLGCHELHSRTPEVSGRPLALTRSPRDIDPPPWEDTTVSYDRYVQPVLDQYCGKCHQGEGEGRKTFDMTRRPGFLIFDEPYATITGRPTWGTPYQRPENPPPGFGIAGTLMVEGYSTVDPAAYKTPAPMTALSYRSRLIEIASSGKHNDVKVDPVNLQRLITWVDTMCPYRGHEEVRAIDDPVFQGVDWISIRPRIKTAPTIVRPGPIDNWEPPAE